MVIAVCAAALTALLVLHLPALPPPWLPLLGVGVLAVGRGRCCRASLLAAAVVVGAGGSAIQAGGRWHAAVLPGACERLPLTVAGTIDGLVARRPALHGGEVSVLVLRVESLLPADCAGPRRVRLYWNDAPLLLPGDHIRGEVVLRVPWGLANTHSPNAQRAHASNGIHGLGSVRSAAVMARRVPGPGWQAVHARREHLAARLRATLKPERATLLAALLLGDRRELRERHWQRLRTYGLSHLFVVSGMHVSLLAGVGWLTGSGVSAVLALFGAARAQGMMPAGGALLFGAAYAAVSGWGLPAQRALLMLLPVLLLAPAGRRPRGVDLLAVALLVLLLVQPMAVLGAGLWLSVGAVAALLWLSAAAPRLRGLPAALSLHGYMTLAMLPAGLLLFGAAATLGGVINLLAVPLVALWVLPVGVLGLALDGMLPGLASLCWECAATPLGVLWDALGTWEETVQQRSLLRAHPPASTLIATIVAVVAVPLLQRRRLAAAAAALLLPLVLSLQPELRRTRDAVSVTVFDVGQGTAVLVREGSRALLYDTGGAYAEGSDLAARAILPHLRATRVTALDHLIISHFDADHAGGLETIVASYPPATFWSPTGTQGAVACRPGRTRRLGPRVLVRALSVALPGDSDNDGSCVVMIEVDDARLLLAGDISAARERALAAYWGEKLAADALLVAHHGSSTSTSALWLRHVRPRHALVTAARANRFGHPAADVLRRLHSAGTRVWNTGTDGALRLVPAGEGWHIAPTRTAGRPFWWLHDSASPHRLTATASGGILARD